jgi:hypothetical protein
LRRVNEYALANAPRACTSCAIDAATPPGTVEVLKAVLMCRSSVLRLLMVVMQELAS